MLERKVTMSFEERVKIELELLNLLLNSNSVSDEVWNQAYAAQQALHWMKEPALSKSPYETIVTGKVYR